MKLKNLLTKTLLAAGLLCVGGNAWAGEVTSLYERGTTNAWTDADLTDWSSSYCTPTISSGLSVNTTNAGWTNTKAISVTANSIVTLDATLKTGGASGRSGSYDYVKIGGVIVGFNEQDKVAFVNIDGATTNLSLTYNRNSAYVIQVVINQATGDVSYKVGSAVGSSTSSTAITGVEFGHSKAGKENYGITTVLQKIEVSEEKQVVSTADYSINYIFNEATIKTVAGTGVIGNTVNAENPITIEGTKYYAKDGEVTSMEITSGTNVLNVDLRTAETYSYTVKAVDGSDNVLNDNLASGSSTEGNAVTVSYPRWVLSGTTLYSCGTGAISYSTTFTPDADNYVKNITYNTDNVSDVVFYTEGEDVTGVSTGTNVRASKGQMGFTADADTYADATTLAPGKYKIYMRSQNGNSAARPYNFKVGEDVVFTGSFGNGTNTDANSEEFTVYENSTLSFASVGSSASGIDYFYVVKTGDATTTATITADYGTFSSAYALDFTPANGVTGVVAYYASAAADGKVTMTKVTGTVPANTGLFLAKDGTGNAISIPVVASSTTELTNLLMPGTGAEVEAGNYVFAKQDDDYGFYRLGSATVVPTGKAYLKAGSYSARMSIAFDDDETTGISATLMNSEESTVNSVFDLQGRRVAQPQKGLYIVNGKKVVIK